MPRYFLIFLAITEGVLSVVTSKAGTLKTGISSYIGLKQTVDPKSWDVGKGALRGNKEEVKTINSYLQEVRTGISTCYQQLQLKGKPVTADSVKDAFLGTHQDIYT